MYNRHQGFRGFAKCVCTEVHHDLGVCCGGGGGGGSKDYKIINLDTTKH
jgi:hypothetical protein